MRMTGLEPARRGHQNLNLARLPIPPHPLTADFTGNLCENPLKYHIISIIPCQSPISVHPLRYAGLPCGSSAS
jgi:hypothetical protein